MPGIDRKKALQPDDLCERSLCSSLYHLFTLYIELNGNLAQKNINWFENRYKTHVYFKLSN